MKITYKSFGVLFCIMCLIGLTFAPFQGSAAELQKSKFALIDGKVTANAKLDQEVVGVIVHEDKDAAGENILYGFTSTQAFQQYLEKNKSTNTLAGQSHASFYEHIDLRGAHFNIKRGYQSSYVGNSWNDKISSVVPSCTGNWTVLYEHRDFKGEAIAIKNSANSCRYYFNLTKYKMNNGKSWNDQASSIKVY